jgi:hypothetical protein
MTKFVVYTTVMRFLGHVWAEDRMTLIKPPAPLFPVPLTRP